jgi:hypothetical protein
MTENVMKQETDMTETWEVSEKFYSRSDLCYYMDISYARRRKVRRATRRTGV